MTEETDRLTIIEKTIADNIIDNNQNNLMTIAFESLGGATIGYAKVFELVDIFTKAFLSIGVKNGDIVTVCAAGTLDVVLEFMALNRLGAVVQYVNPNYFKYNCKKYIDETGCKIMICLDRFYSLIKKEISETIVEQLVITSISEYSSLIWKILAGKQRIKLEDRIDGVQYFTLKELYKRGKNSKTEFKRIPYVKDKPAVVTYTSGTTGNPKGVVHTNDGINNMFSLYDIAGGFGIGVGDRNLVLIPPMYLTSFVHSIFAPMYRGATNILQPVYNPKTLGKDLKKYRPKTVVASKAHYIYLEESGLPKGALHNTIYAYCGGEAISKTVAERINNILDYYGIGPMVLGYGQSEFGTMTMFNFDIPNRTNESGILIPHVKAKILDPITYREVAEGERGELYINTPTVMKEYLNNKEATEAFFVTDENGEKWAKTGDIARVLYRYNGNCVYDVSGRRSDSFIDENGKMVYLFDIETKVEDVEGVREAEVIALTINKKKVPIVHFVLKNGYNQQSVVIAVDAKLKSICENKSSIPYAYKVRGSFSTSPISGKRDYAILCYETDGFIQVMDDGTLSSITLDSAESKVKNELLLSDIR